MGEKNKALKNQTGSSFVPVSMAPNTFSSSHRISNGPGAASTTGGTAPGAAAAGAAPGATTWTNEGAVPDYLNRAVSRLEGRSDASNTAKAIDRSNSGIADSAALLAKDAKANMGSRGVLGSGTGDAYLQRNVFQPAQRMAAKAASDISMGEQTRLDNLAMGGSNILALPSQVAHANQGLNIQQMGMQNQNNQSQQQYNLSQQRLNADRDNDEFSKWMALLQMR